MEGSSKYPLSLTKSQEELVNDTFNAFNSKKKVTLEIDLTKRRKRSFKIMGLYGFDSVTVDKRSKSWFE